MRARPRPSMPVRRPFLLKVRLGLGHDPASLLEPALDAHARTRQPDVASSTAKQGLAIEHVATRRRCASEDAAAELVKALNRVEGVQSVSLERVNGDE